MTCIEVRDHLAERSLGLLAASVAVDVEEHLRTCAACRREAAGLEAAAAQVGLAAATDAPPADLESSVLVAVRGAASSGGRRRGPSRRPSRTALAIVAASFLAVGVLGYGAAMAGRAERYAVRANRAESARADALERFRRVLAGARPAATFPTDDTLLGQLSPVTPGEVGGGAVLQLVSADKLDFTIVIVRGLEAREDLAFPLRIRLRDATGGVLRAGVIRALDGGGRAEVFHEFRDDLSGWTRVEIVDADGRVILAGEVDATR